MKRAFLFAALSFFLAIGESAPIKLGAYAPFAPKRQGGSASFQNAIVGDEREIGGVKLRWCPPGCFVMGSPSDEVEKS